MYFHNYDYLVNMKKKSDKSQKYSILFLILIIVVFYRIFYSYQEKLNMINQKYESISNTLRITKEYKNNINKVIENTSYLSKILSSNSVKGQIAGSNNESQLILNGNEKLINRIIQDISKEEKLNIKNIEFYIRGSGNKEAKITFGEYVYEE